MIEIKLSKVSFITGLILSLAYITGIQFTAKAEMNWSTNNQPIGKSKGCYYIKSLNLKYQQSDRFLDAAVDKKTVKLVDVRSHGTIWDIRQTNNGYILRSMNQNYKYQPYYLDAEVNGKKIKIQNANTHGIYWKLTGNRNKIQFQSLNRNHANYLDAASDGSTAKLVNAITHGTFWQLKSVKCPY